MPIVSLFQRQGDVFDTEATRLMSAAFDASTTRLIGDGTAQGLVASRELLAKIIIELFKAGERDCDRMAERALAAFAAQAARGSISGRASVRARTSPASQA